MKQFLLTFAALILSQTASAEISANSSWEEIFAAKGPYRIHAPVVYMGRAIDYTFVCRDGDNLRTKAPVDTVVTEVDKMTTFKVVSSDVLSTPIKYVQHEDFCDSTSNRVVCTQKTYTGVYPMTVNIKVGKKLSHGRETYLFTKSYTVPNCEDVSVN